MQTPLPSDAEPFPLPSLPPLTLPSSVALEIPPNPLSADDHAIAAARSAGGPMDSGELRRRVDDAVFRVDELEHRVDQVSRFYSSRRQDMQTFKARGGFIAKEKAGTQRRHADTVRKEGLHSKRMVELMRQFGTILRNISQHKYAWLFMDPVDVEGLGLHDYYEIVQKPMDLGTIKKRMEAKDGTGYKNVREIYADVILVFTNALAYNSETHDVHKMAKVMMSKFEEKWQQLLPKVIEEETRQKEESETHADIHISQEIAFAKMARDSKDELNEISSWLEDLKQMVLMRCRKISTEEKRKIAAAFGILPSEEIYKALDVIAQLNPNFSAREQNIELDIDALDEATLWSLKFRMDAMLEQRAKNSASKSQDDNTKRRREICDALAKTARKRSKKLATS